MSEPVRDTRDAAYTRRLHDAEAVWWKRALDAQRPYRWNVRRLGLGRVLDVGCGIGRNLVNLGGQGVGVDHNPASVEVCRRRGLTAYTPEEFGDSLHAEAGRFDSLLLAHVVEHMTPDQATALIRTYRPYVRAAGTLVLICPQEAGYRTDESHVHFADFDALDSLCRDVGGTVTRRFSFPFPRPLGRVFRYNEFIVVARLP
jgi:2-polyprenyl-3-methyl-5-hydroxy-6-metoxy-1,4-benzoquinol methylase